MSWCFALINGRLAEIYFNETKRGIKFLGHCYVNRSEYVKKREQKWIEVDTANFKLSFRNKKYRRLI